MSFAHTFSIVARDPSTGEIGVAVQSHWFAVGTVVPWAGAGVGAVATQSFCEPAYGRDGLSAMAGGESAEATLRRMVAGDGASEIRQVAMIDATGKTAVWTGGRCVEHAGHYTPGGRPEVSPAGRFSLGADFSVQANLMDNGSVWPAMAEAFAASTGDLADRMLATLDAAQTAGGDARGMQSAALLVVAAASGGQAWIDRRFDVRVDDAPNPLVELRRLVHVQRAYLHMNAGDLALERNDPSAASAAFSAAAGTAPGSAEILFWQAVALFNQGTVEPAFVAFGKAFKLNPSWRTILPRVVQAGLLSADNTQVGQILRVVDISTY